ncbi:MAG: DUF1080 domain-containing protein [Sedimentisphaerales bacterium]|nr:DUF1080 domain-containing protein [Sedimentisphaerales bacterium]
MNVCFPVEQSQRRGLWDWHSGRAAAGLLASLLVIGFCLAGCRSAHPVEEAAASQGPATATPQTTFEPGRPVSLFDGQSLGLWNVTEFGGQGDVSVKDGAIVMEMGNYATGITWAGPLVRMNYEITLDALRIEGSDFFCGLTFPVGESPCTLILGGWGGTLCGLSSLNYFDASENETTTFVSFENGKWYHVRLRVVPNRIQVWLDDESLIDVDTTGRHIDIRMEMDLCVPLGIATWVTTGAVRNIYLTRLPEGTE